MKLITVILLNAVSLAFLAHLTFIWIYGELFIQEPNNIILSYETAGFIIIISYGIREFIQILKRS